MHLTDLAITNFRCLSQVQLSPSPALNVILGSNGAGKTSVLEAIFCLSRGRSFRANSLTKLIQDSHTSFVVRAKLSSDVTHQLAIQATKGSATPNYQAKIDGEPIKSFAELSRVLPAIIIDPAVHKLIEDGPSLRRQYLDWGVFHVEPRFMHEWRRYQQALKQRNAGLKKGISGSQLRVWTDILLESGLFIDKSRKDYIQSLLPEVSSIASHLLDADIKLAYRSGWAKDLSFSDALEHSSIREKKVGLTVVGPHRADLSIQVGGLMVTSDIDESESAVELDTNQKEDFYKVQQRVSRGQQKLIAASLILAQAQYFRAKHNISPLLLIDDPFAELDLNHTNRLLVEIEKLKAQTFITTLNPIKHVVFEEAKKFHVEHGVLKLD